MVKKLLLLELKNLIYNNEKTNCNWFDLVN